MEYNLKMSLFLLIAFFNSGHLVHPDYGNELHILYSIFQTEDGKKIGIGAGFFRGEFLSFSLGALLFGYIPSDEEPDYEVHPIWSGGYPVENTAYVFGEKGMIKIEGEDLYATLTTKNYSFFLKSHSLNPGCEFKFQSSDAEETLFIPRFQSEGRVRVHGVETNLSGFSFFWNLWGRKRLKLNDHVVFCAGEQCGFIQFDMKKKLAKMFICPKKEEVETEFAIRRFSKGKVTGKYYPSEIELKNEGMRINVSSMKQEAKLLTLSYLIALVEIEKNSKRGSGFIFFHPLEEKKKWEF